MAVYDLGPGSGARWGATLGGGINNLLTGLAQHKGQQLQHRSLTQALHSQGIPNASGLATLLQTQPQAGLKALEHHQGEREFRLKEAEQQRKQSEGQAFAQLANQLYGGVLAPQQQPQMPPQQGQPQQPGGQNIPTRSTVPQQGTSSAFPTGSKVNPGAGLNLASVSPQGFGQIVGLAQKEKANAIAQGNLNIAEKKFTLAETTAADKKKIAEDTLAERKRANLVNETIQDEKHKLNLDKLAIEQSEPYIQADKAADKTLRDLKTIRSIIKSGKAKTGSLYALADKLGFTELVGTPETEILAKTYARMAQDVVGAFGADSKITNYIEQTFQRSLITLGNSPEAALAITDTIELAANLKKAENRARREVLEEDDGKWKGNTKDRISDLTAESEGKLIDRAKKKLDSYVISKNPQEKKADNAKFNKGPINPKSMPEGFLIEAKDGSRFRVVNGEWQEA